MDEKGKTEGTKQVRIRRSLHKKLKAYAAEKDKSLQEIVEGQCWPLVGDNAAASTSTGEAGK